MLTYTSPSAVTPQQEPNAKPWLLLLLCVFWLIPGLIGHDPWKPFEAQTTDIVWNFLQGQSWVLPVMVDTPYLERGPLFFWMAALLGRIIPVTWLSLHDIVRITSSLLTALSMWGVGLAGRELYGRRFGRYAVLALIGSVGLVFWGHHASPQMLSMAAFAWLVYALVWGIRRPLPAGLIMGIAFLALFLGGVTRELILAILFVVCALCFQRWRRIHILVMLGTALIIAIPVGLFWPLALKQASPEAYAQWLDVVFMRNGIVQRQILTGLLYYLGLMPWFSWPALPAALWSIWNNRHELHEPKWRLPIAFLISTFFWLVLLAGETNDHVALPILIPLALLATGGLEAQRRGLASALNWFGMVTFGLGVIAIWLIWMAVHFGVPVGVARRAAEFNTNYAGRISYPAVLFALGITLAWCWVLSRKRQLGKQALVNWTCGMTLIWGSSMTLLLPWLDASKTYRDVALSLKAVLPVDSTTCLAGQGLSDAVVASFHYFAGITTKDVAQEQGGQCRLLLVQSSSDSYLAPPQARLLWSGARSGESRERFYLYRLREQASGNR